VQSQVKEIIVACPRGFCAGVVRAIETVQNTLKYYGVPVYVLHEIVHNKHVIKDLQKSGVVFVEELADIPAGGICIFSAHGVSVAVEKLAANLSLKTVDATCPLVSSIHRIVEKYHRQEYDIVIIGHHNHPEVEGTAGRVSRQVHVVANEEEALDLQIANPEKCAYVTQTTLGQDAVIGIRQILMAKYPKMQSSTSNICYATQNRQDAVKRLAEVADMILVVGSKNSSNSNRLREVSIRSGVAAYLIDDKNDIDPLWFEDKHKIGITAGASAPERLVEGVVEWIRQRWQTTYAEMAGEEKMVYFKPAEPGKK
jgi:4-hydroxy-3-methylbut-2-enyl diphosphate reductase